MKTLKNIISKRNLVSLILLLIVFNQTAIAQLKPVNAIYYFNDFIMNPSMAGREQKINASAGYRQQLTSFNEAPKSQFLTADYGFTDKSGLGIKIYNDDAGLLRQTSVALSYAYHLPLNDVNKLHFGLSGIFSDFKLNNVLVNGDMDDPDLVNVNQRRVNIDSDFGMAFTTENLNVQAVFPSMVATLRDQRENETNYSLFFSSISYRFNSSIGELEPKIIYRGVKGFKNILDIGTNLVFQSRTTNQLNLLAIYHTSKNVSMGFGITTGDDFNFTTSYTLGASQIRGYSNGDLEFGIKMKF